MRRHPGLDKKKTDAGRPAGVRFRVASKTASNEQGDGPEGPVWKRESGPCRLLVTAAVPELPGIPSLLTPLF